MLERLRKNLRSSAIALRQLMRKYLRIKRLVAVDSSVGETHRVAWRCQSMGFAYAQPILHPEHAISSWLADNFEYNGYVKNVPRGFPLRVQVIMAEPSA